MYNLFSLKIKQLIFGPIRSNLIPFGVHLLLFSQHRSYSVHYDPIRSYLSYSVHISPLCPIQFTLVLFGPPCSHLVIFCGFGPLCSIWSICVHFSPFRPLRFILVCFGPFLYTCIQGNDMFRLRLRVPILNPNLLYIYISNSKYPKS